MQEDKPFIEVMKERVGRRVKLEYSEVPQRGKRSSVTLIGRLTDIEVVRDESQRTGLKVSLKLGSWTPTPGQPLQAQEDWQEEQVPTDYLLGPFDAVSRHQVTSYEGDYTTTKADLDADQVHTDYETDTWHLASKGVPRRELRIYQLA